MYNIEIEVLLILWYSHTKVMLRYQQEHIRTGGQIRACMCKSNRSPIVQSKLLNHTKNRTPGHVLSNHGLYLCTAAQYMLLFLVLAVNSNWFQIYRVTCSYSSHLFLCAIGPKQSYLEVVHLVAVFVHLNSIESEINNYVSTAGTINSQRRLEAGHAQGSK